MIQHMFAEFRARLPGKPTSDKAMRRNTYDGEEDCLVGLILVVA